MFRKFASRASAITLALYWVFIFIGTHTPGGTGSWFWFNDKVLHFSAYAGLGFLLGWVLSRSGWTVWRLCAGLGIIFLYGAIDEFSQGWVPNRSADVWDWVADVSGAALGLSVLLFARWWIAKRDGFLASQSDSPARMNRQIR